MNPQNKSVAEITKEVWRLVDVLPHRSAIVDSDARSWVDEVVGLHGEAAIWHAIRLNGFGGSEIGVLVRNHQGVRADHQASAHDIVAGKLMRKAPTETSGHMTRGHENEEPHARRFYSKYGAHRDVEAYEILKSAQGKRPWMRYSPDDVVQMPVMLVADDAGQYFPSQRGEQNHRWLIDYKAPSKVEQNDEIHFQYACQLAQGAILCHEAGVQLHGMMLSQFDWANWLLKDDVIMWDQNIGQAVLDAGDNYWEYVTQGRVPDFIRTLEVQGLDEYKTSHLVPAEMYAELSALADAAENRAKQIRAELLRPVADRRFAGKKVSFGAEGAPVLKVGAKLMLDRDAAAKVFTQEQLDACSGALAYDAKAMEQYLRASGVDMVPFRTRDLDATKVYALAAEIGIDADVLVKEQVTLTTDKSVKNRMLDYIDTHYPLSAALVQRETEGTQEAEVEEEQLQEQPVS